MEIHLDHQMVVCQHRPLMLETMHIIIAIMVTIYRDRHHVYVKAQDPGVEFSRHVFVSTCMKPCYKMRVLYIN